MSAMSHPNAIEDFLSQLKQMKRSFIGITRNENISIIDTNIYDDFVFKTGDVLNVFPFDKTKDFVITPDANVNIRTNSGCAIRVPPKFESFKYKGFDLPVHLVILTGAGPETWEIFGLAHVTNYKKFMQLDRGMTFLEIGCGIGRDAFQLIEILGPEGSYFGVDVTRDSILWCVKNISEKNSNFKFFHFDARHELYNPLGKKSSLDFSLPVENNSVDRIALGSIFTHLFEDEVVHYMKEIRRVLKPDGLAYATFFLYSDETITAAKFNNNTPFNLKFQHFYKDGCFVNDSNYPTGAVAYTNEKMKAMIHQGGLRLTQPYLMGAWSGAFKNTDDGQEVALLSPA